jgi:hypothetical protein
MIGPIAPEHRVVLAIRLAKFGLPVEHRLTHDRTVSTQHELKPHPRISDRLKSPLEDARAAVHVHVRLDRHVTECEPLHEQPGPP